MSCACVYYGEGDVRRWLECETKDEIIRLRRVAEAARGYMVTRTADFASEGHRLLAASAAIEKLRAALNALESP
jgi:hypothetical protein